MTPITNFTNILFDLSYASRHCNTSPSMPLNIGFTGIFQCHILPMLTQINAFAIYKLARTWPIWFDLTFSNCLPAINSIYSHDLHGLSRSIRGGDTRHPWQMTMKFPIHGISDPLANFSASAKYCTTWWNTDSSAKGVSNVIRFHRFWRM